MAQLQGGEDPVSSCGCNSNPTRIENPQFSQGGMHCDYNAIPFKTIKEMKQACTQYGTNPPSGMGLTQGLSQAERLVPYDWEIIARELGVHRRIFTV